MLSSPEHHLSPGWQCVEKKTPQDLIPDFSQCITIDCEMVTTAQEAQALARVSAIDFEGRVGFLVNMIWVPYLRKLSAFSGGWFLVFGM